MNHLSELSQALLELDDDRVLSLVHQRLVAGESPLTLLDECQAGMAAVGERFETGEYFLAELMLSGEIFQEAFALLEQGLHSGGQTAPTAGQVVMGTVEGDIHNIGKDMVVSVLTANGFQVHNLGEDVPPDLFVAKLKETSAPVLGLSGLITTSFDSMRSTVDALVQAGIRDGVKVMIGGAVVDEHVRAFVGADAWGRDPFQAVKLAQQLAGG